MAANPKSVYTTSSAFFEAICDAGITHVFANLGSDHPALLEAMVKGQRERRHSFPKVITCPNEMVALSMADGFARLTGRPQCVLVHVDVGTQALAQAIHNASCGRAPVLIFAGLSPVTLEGEYRGSRTEVIHWLQDVPDQKQIVAQYCRYTAEIKVGRNVKQMVNRALQFATSDPKGPVYLCGSREVMEEDIEPYYLNQEHWTPVEPTPLPQSGVKLIVDHLTSAQSPLIIVGSTGRNPDSVTALVEICDKVPKARVIDAGCCEMSFPADHPAFLVARYASGPDMEKADFILLVDIDVPWVPTQNRPSDGTKIIHIDMDVLKQQMPLFYYPAFARYSADSCTAFAQINAQLDAQTTGAGKDLSDLLQQRQNEFNVRRQAIVDQAKMPDSLHESSINASQLGRLLKDLVPADTIFAVEAITLGGLIIPQLAPSLPKSWIHCGGGGLGWSGGGALGIKLASDFLAKANPSSPGTTKGKFVCQIVGDGSYMFSIPSSVYWISRRYGIPILTVVLNNSGWNAPRHSMLLVHPEGEGSKVDNKELNISFDPSPDYAGIAVAATGGQAFGATITTLEQLTQKLPEAVAAVGEGRSAVLDVKIV